MASDNRRHARRRKWEANLDLLRKFVRENGTLPRTSGTDREPFERAIGGWLKNQRDPRAKHDARQRVQLEALSVFAPRETRWDKRVEDYRGFWSNNRRDPLKSSQEPFESSLARWLELQRKAHRSLKLQYRRSAELSDINPDWERKPLT
ncbi:helicase associated domain-containing protein [Mycetocola zhujimingii]|uniref:helicase associated domain-containing protein n=1 Tax=Mycetocola zhujimingii TaxID=2079792 RepID=UPI0039F652DF